MVYATVLQIQPWLSVLHNYYAEQKNIDKSAQFKAELGRLTSTHLKKMGWL